MRRENRNYNRKNGQARDINPAVELMREIKNKPIKEIGLEKLVKPNGYAYRIARELELKKSQVRKVYAEFKWIYERLKKNNWEFNEDILTRLYMLYPIIEYQKNRKVLNKSFADLITALLENIENYHDKENIETAENFFTAVVAYIVKEG